MSELLRYLKKVIEYSRQQNILDMLFFFSSKIIDKTPFLGNALWRFFYVNSAEKKTKEPQINKKMVLSLLDDLRINVKQIEVDQEKYFKYLENAKYPEDYFGGKNDTTGFFHDYGMQHFFSIEFLNPKKNGLFLDVASYTSPFPTIIRGQFGCKVLRQDLVYPSGQHGDSIGCDACNMPIQDETVDYITTHNAFHHFEGNRDTYFIKEAYRILKPGGKLLIIPLMVNHLYYILVSAFIRLRWLEPEFGAELIFQHKQSGRFERYYSPFSLQQRVLSASKGFKGVVYAIKNSEKITSRSTTHFALLLEK